MKRKSDLVGTIIVLCSLTLLPLSTLAKSSGSYWQKQIISQTKYVDDYFEQDKYGREKINIFIGDQPIATVDSGEIYFNLADHLGSTSFLIDENANIVETNDYDDFGKLLSVDSQIRNNDKFLAQELDRETNLGYFVNRYYDSHLARFMSMDPWLSSNVQDFLSDPQKLNSYSYAGNNPIRFLDKNGLKVSEFQPYYSSDGFYDYEERYGQYRNIGVISAGVYSGKGWHDYQCVSLFQKFTDSQYDIRIGGLGSAMNYGQQDKLNSKSTYPGQFVAYSNGSSMMPQENDLITWSHNNGVGHIGVIIEVSFDDDSGTGYVYSMEQNYSGRQPIYTQGFSRSYDGSGQAVYTVDNRGSYTVQSWVRYNQQENIPYSNILYTPAPGNYINN